MGELTWLKTNHLPPQVYLSMDQVPDLTPTQLFKQGCWHRRGAVVSQRDRDPHFTPSLPESIRLKQLMDWQEEAGTHPGACA